MSNPNVEPLAQDFVVAARVPDHTRFFFHDPNLGRLSDGTLLIAAPQWPRPGMEGRRELRISRSRDGGGSWQELDTLPYQEGIPFELDGELLMFVQEESHRDIQIVASGDRGGTWSEPSTVLEGPLWNISTARVVRGDRIFWAVDRDLPGMGHGGKTMLTCDRSRSPLDPAAWSVSNVVEPPALPAALTRNLYPRGGDPRLFPYWSGDFKWLEPNTVDVGGRIRVFARTVIDQYASAHLAAVLDYDEEENRLSFTQLAA